MMQRKRKPGGGRKPKAYTILKRRLIAELGIEAEKSIDFYIQVRDNPNEPTMIRMEAAKRIEERAFGKPKEPHEQSGELVIRIVRERDNPNSTATPSEPSDDSSASKTI